MKKEFLLNIILLLAINFLIKPLYIFGVDLQIQNIVGEETYGMYKVLFNIAFLFQFIHEPGIQSFNSQNIAKNPNSLGFHMPRILGLKLLLGIVYFIVTLIYYLSNPYDDNLMPLMVIIAINLFLSTLFLYLRTNIAAIGKYRIDSLLSALDKLLMLIILGYLVWTPIYRDNFQIIWLAYGQFIAFAISCIVALYLLRKHLGVFQISFSWDYSKKLLKWSFPYALILLSMSAYSRMDSIMLERLLNDDGYETGVYEYGYRFLEALNMVGYMFAALLVPMYATNINAKKTINELLDMGLRLMSLISIIGACTFITFRHEIMTWAKASATWYHEEILFYLILSFVCISIAYLFGSLLVANNSLKKLNILLVVGVVINFGLNYFLIPTQHALGAAKATFVTQALMTIGQVFLVYTIIKIKIDGKLLFNILVFGLFCALIYWGIYNYININWIIQVLLCISFSLFSALLLRLVEFKMITGLISKKTNR
ncbi:MAG: oligosaccharide flippase family protein [Saprospiraceae bacterium]